MAIEHFLKMYPCPEDTQIYTGLFKDRGNTPWSDRPKKNINGVSYTQYADAMDISFYDRGQSENISLFELFHGRCWYYAQYFHCQNPGWQLETIYRGNGWENIIHTFCSKIVNGRMLLADARGITDDTSLFFRDFTCSKNAYVSNNQKADILTKKDKESPKWTPEAFSKAYKYIFGDISHISSDGQIAFTA